MISNNQKLNIALIGAGNIAQNLHIPTITSFENNFITHILEKSPVSTTAVKKKFPDLTPNFVSSLEEINYNNINTAIICTPTAFHYEHTKHFLERGIHVFCEKPLAKTFIEAQELTKLAEKNNCILQAGYYRRFQPTTRYIQEALKNNRYGKLISCEIRGGWIAKSDLSSSILDKSISGGGILMDYGVHFIDRLYSWFEELIIENYRDDSIEGVEINSVLNLKVKKGSDFIPVKLLLSWTSEMGNSIQLNFENIILKLNINDANKISFLNINNQNNEINSYFRTKTLTLEPEDLSVPQLQWKEFINRIQGGKEIFSRLHDALKTTHLVEQCYTKKQTLNLNWGN